MKIDDHICSLEQAKKLEILGVLQNSQWYYLSYTSGPKLAIHTKNTANRLYGYSLKKYGDQNTAEMCSAFTLAELILMLREDFIVKYNDVHDAPKILARKIN